MSSGAANLAKALAESHCQPWELAYLASGDVGACPQQWPAWLQAEVAKQEEYARARMGKAPVRSIQNACVLFDGEWWAFRILYFEIPRHEPLVLPPEIIKGARNALRL